MKRAFIFPGQGAQKVGMGKDLSDNFPAARRVFDEVDEALGENLSLIVWEGEQEALNLTVNAQPALMATSMAVLAALESEGFPVDEVACRAGHSLGEYSALCAAGSLSLADAARLLRARGAAMQEAVPVGEGAMAALLGLDIGEVEKVVAEASPAGVCEIANDNDPGQVVISGEKGAVEKAAEIGKAAGAKRAVLLPVSAPFHCSLMRPAAESMRGRIADAALAEPNAPIVSNVTSRFERKAERFRQLLVEQITGRVRWRESLLEMAANGVAELCEIGAGSALSGMARRIDRSFECRQCGSASQVGEFISAMEGR